MSPLPELFRLLVTIALLLLASHGVGHLFAWLRQPRVIGEIVGGLLLGPTLLGWCFPESTTWLFPKDGPTAAILPALSQVGLVLLMYASGSQLKTFIAPGEKKLVAALAFAGTVVPLFAGLAYLQFVDFNNLIGSAQNATAFTLVFVTAIAIASIPVISRIMLDLGIMQTPFARVVIATAVIDDLILYLVLAVALGLVSATSLHQHWLWTAIGIDAGGVWAPILHVLATVLVIALTLAIGPQLWKWAARKVNPLLAWDHSVVVHVTFLALVSGSCLALGVNPMFGALAAGMTSARAATRYGIAESATIKRLATWVLVPLYFALVGARLDLVHQFDPVYFVEFLAFACAAKAISIYAGARTAGESPASSLNLAAALNARGGPGIVLASVAFEAGIVNENFFAILVMTAIVTSLAAGSWLGRAVRSGRLLQPAPTRWQTIDSLESKLAN